MSGIANEQTGIFRLIRDSYMFHLTVQASIHYYILQSYRIAFIIAGAYCLPKTHTYIQRTRSSAHIVLLRSRNIGVRPSNIFGITRRTRINQSVLKYQSAYVQFFVSRWFCEIWYIHCAVIPIKHRVRSIWRGNIYVSYICVLWMCSYLLIRVHIEIPYLPSNE